MKRIICFFGLVFTLMFLLSSCGDPPKGFDITVKNNAYYNRITTFKFYSSWDYTRDTAPNLLAQGETIDVRSSKTFAGLAEKDKTYSYYIEYENGDTRKYVTLTDSILIKYDSDATIESDPGKFLTYRVRNGIGVGYEIHYIVLQPAGVSDTCYYREGDDFPYYDVYQNSPGTFKRLTFTSGYSVENGEAALYDIYIFAWYADASRPDGGDYYVAVDKNINLKDSTGYLSYQANRWKGDSAGSVTFDDIKDGYWANANKLKNKFLQLQNKD